MEIFKTCFFMCILTVLFVVFGAMIGGKEGVIMAFLLALGINFFSYFFSDKLVLKHYNAQSVNPSEPVYKMVARLAHKAQLPMPKVYIIPDSSPNAFATGRNPANAAVCATQGLLSTLNPNEVEAVLAHELAHVRHYDILTGSIAAVMAGAVATLASFAQFGAMGGGDNKNSKNGALLLILAFIMPVAATMIQMAISREREYKADKGAAILTGHPEHLISALQKISAAPNGVRGATEQSAHLFIYSPFRSFSSLGKLFSTHPSLDDRIAALRQIQAELRSY